MRAGAIVAAIVCLGCADLEEADLGQEQLETSSVKVWDGDEWDWGGGGGGGSSCGGTPCCDAVCSCANGLQSTACYASGAQQTCGTFGRYPGGPACTIQCTGAVGGAACMEWQTLVTYGPNPCLSYAGTNPAQGTGCSCQSQSTTACYVGTQISQCGTTGIHAGGANCNTCSSVCSCATKPGRLCRTDAGVLTSCGGYRSYATCDADADGIVDLDEDALALEFAPRFEHDASEAYFPSSVEWYLARVEQAFAHAGGGDHHVQANPGTSAVLVSRWHAIADDPSRPLFANVVRAVGPGDEEFFLQIWNNAQEGATQRGAIDTARCYAHVSRSSVVTGGIDLQYWVFFPRNDYDGALGSGDHEGDWEHITVTVYADRDTVHSAYFAAHDDEGHRAYPGGPNVLLLDASGKRATAYVARGTHAMYPRAGVTWRASGMFDLADDVHRGGGPVLDCADRVVEVGERSFPRHDQDWLKYGGRWGEIGAGPDDLQQNGPHTPSDQAGYWPPDRQR